MKLCMICACLIAMLIFSAVGFAEILDWGEGRTSNSVSASASHGTPYDEEGDSSDNGQYTTVDGTFSYNHSVSVDIEVYANPVGGWARSTAAASADAGPLSVSLSYDTGDTSTYDVYDPPPIHPMMKRIIPSSSLLTQASRRIGKSMQYAR